MGQVAHLEVHMEWLDTDIDPNLCRYCGGKLIKDSHFARGFVWATCVLCGAIGPIGKLLDKLPKEGPLNA